MQDGDEHARKLRAGQLAKDWQNINGMLHHQGLSYVPEIIRAELISRYHNDPLAGHFCIEKIHELISQKYHWLMLCNDVEDYVKRCDVYLALKAV